LRAPETVSQTIEFLVYYSGGDDLEFAVPRNISNFAPVNPVPIVLPPAEDIIFEEELEPHAGLVFEDVGGDPHKSENIHYASSSIGEKFLSVKQFLNKLSRYYIQALVVPPNPGVWNPWVSNLGIISDNSTVPDPINPALGGDSFDFIQKFYAFYRGSLRVAITANGPGAMYVANGPGRAYADVTNFPIFSADSFGLSPGSVPIIPWFNAPQTNARFLPVAIQDEASGQVVTTLPYYSKTHCSLCTNAPIVLPPPTFNKDRSAPDSNLRYAKAGATDFAFYRSCADDFQFSYFLGTPPLWRSSQQGATITGGEVPLGLFP